MAELPADLKTLVEAQAQARVDMSIQGYAKYLTPQAIDSLRASFPGVPPRVNRFEIEGPEEQGGAYVVDVRYFSRDNSFVVRSKWERTNTGWAVTHAERLWAEGDKKPGFLSKMAANIGRMFLRRRRPKRQ